MWLDKRLLLGLSLCLALAVVVVVDALVNQGEAWICLGVVAIWCSGAMALRRRVAVELMGWVVLGYLVAVLGKEYFNTWWSWWAFYGVLLLLGFVLLLAGRKQIFGTVEVPKSRWRDFARAVRLTLALFLLFEAASRLIVLTIRKELIIWDTSHPIVEENDYLPGRPTVATLGSSPANRERVSDRPFTVMLAERLGGGYNFIHYRTGGTNSSRLFQNAEELVKEYSKVDAFILYAGFQDYNQPREMLEGSREFFQVARTGLRWVMERSALLRLLLYQGSEAARRLQLQRIRDGGGHLTPELVFDYYRTNIERIIRLADEHGIQMFAVTISLDRSVASKEVNRYADMVNAYLKSLPSIHPSVKIVDFASVLESSYPQGKLANCEPYEPIPGENRCGDPFHLGLAGHKLLADMLEPVLLTWRVR